MTRKSLFSFFLLLLLTGAACALWAQGSNGSLTGTAVDASHAILPGALIELQPVGRKAVSDDQGHFRIADVPPGKYTLGVTYVGFAPLAMPIEIKSGDNTEQEAMLSVGSAVDEIIVSGERLHGEAEAINIERTSENIVQVLPSKVINSLPNTNVADAVGRLPSVTLERDEGEGKYVQIRGTEPRLSNTTIDGVNVPSPEGTVRNVKLDVIPSGLVERIEVNKTLSANQDADAIGGSVNLVTRSPGERAFYELGAQGGYTPIQDGRWLDGFYGTAGKRFGANHNFGALLGLTYDHNDRAIDDLEPFPTHGQDINGNNVAYFSTEDLRTYKYYRTRYGFAGGLDYVARQGTDVYLKGLFSDFHDYGDTWVYTPNAGNTIKSVNGTTVTFDNAADCAPINAQNQITKPGSSDPCSPGSMQYRHYIRRPDQQIFSILSGVTQELGTSILTVQFAGARSHNIGGQDFQTTNFNGPSVDLALDQTNHNRPKFIALDGTNILDPSLYTMSKVSLTRQHSTQVNFQGSASLAHPYTFHTHSGIFEFGMKIRNAQKTQNENDHIYDSPTGATPTLSQGLSTNQSNPNYYDGTLKVGPLSSYNKLHQNFVSDIGSFTFDNTASRTSSDASAYGATERVYAGYGMNSLSFGKFRLQTGLRIEATDATFNAFAVNLSNGNYVNTVPVPGSSGYINFLPSIQLQYQIEPNTNLRVTYGRGISRPNFADIVPSQQLDPNTTPPSIQQGNPKLKATSANDFDLLGEHYFKSLGVVEAGFFYKGLADPIYPTTSQITISGNPNGQLKQSVNGPSAHIAGFETAIEQRLSFLPGAFSGLGVSANYSYTTSQVTFPAVFGRSDHAALQRQAPNTYNIGMTYDKARFAMRFGLSHNDANIYSYGYGGGTPAQNKDPILGLRGPGGDQYLYAHTQYDVQGSYRILRGLQLIGSGLNLSNEVFGFYQGSAIYPIQREYYKPSAIFGLRWTSSAE